MFMKLHLFPILAGLALIGSVYAQALPLPPVLPPGDIITGQATPMENTMARIIFHNDLKIGMSGGEVFELQYILQVRGYLPSDHALTNYFGAKTQAAVMAFQRARGISATGFVGPLTRAALNGDSQPDVPPPPDLITANLGVGSSGAQVRLLQNKLRALGYFSGEATGYFGIKTRAAVVAFQQAQGISPTGFVGPITRAALNNAETPPLPPPPSVEQITMREGQREGPFSLQKVYSDYVTGLNFAEYPIAVEQGRPITLRVGDIVSNGCTITMELVRIESNNQSGPTATFLKKIDTTKTCPVCLPGNAMIDTPNGQVSVKNLTEGMLVWTGEADGTRVPAPVLKTTKVSVSNAHIMVSLELEDGRVLTVSPGHPTADGKKIGNLTAGDMLNGSKIKSTKVVSYSGGFTYDILPAGATGTYWADGILIGSTLK